MSNMTFRVKHNEDPSPAFRTMHDLKPGTVFTASLVSEKSKYMPDFLFMFAGMNYEGSETRALVRLDAPDNCWQGEELERLRFYNFVEFNAHMELTLERPLPEGRTLNINEFPAIDEDEEEAW